MFLITFLMGEPMKTVPIRLTMESSAIPSSLLDPDADPFTDLDQIDVQLERNVPENAVEQQIYSMTITHAVWLSANHVGDETIRKPVPIHSVKHLKEGYFAYLTLRHADWDDKGRLQGTVSVISEWVGLSTEDETEVYEYPIFYSVVSSLEHLPTRTVRILYEFPPSPVNKNEHSNVSSDSLGQSRLLPSLDIPRDHPWYEEKSHIERPYANRRNIPDPVHDRYQVEDDQVEDDQVEDDQGDTTESWLASMSPDERAATMNNLDWND